MTNFEKVGLFMKTFGQEVKNKPSLSSDKINHLRILLHIIFDGFLALFSICFEKFFI